MAVGATRVLLLAWVGSAVAVPVDARADASNFRPYVVGARAAGMGGAFTAIADDGSGPFYNPGGVGFIQRSQLSLSGSVYGVASGSFADALGDGHDFRFSSMQTFPTATAGVFRLGPDDPDGADVIALTVYLPDAVTIDDRDTIGSRENAFIFTTQSQTVWAGATYAHRWGRFAIGASGFFLFGTEINQLALTAVSPASASQFATITSRFDQTTYGFVGALGARWDATDHLRVGLAVYSPEVGFGTRRAFVSGTVGDGVTAASAPAQAVVVNADGLHAAPTLPLRVQAGVAWTSGPLTISGDVMALAARDVHDDADKAAQGLDQRTVRNAVVNGALGVEYVFGHVPLRAGFFTDFAASNVPVAANLSAGADPNASNTSHVDRYGGTFSVGYRTEHTATDLGLVVSGGSGTDLVPNNLDFTQVKPTRATQLLAYVFLGTAYEF